MEWEAHTHLHTRTHTLCRLVTEKKCAQHNHRATRTNERRIHFQQHPSRPTPFTILFCFIVHWKTASRKKRTFISFLLFFFLFTDRLDNKNTFGFDGGRRGGDPLVIMMVNIFDSEWQPKQGNNLKSEKSFYMFFPQLNKQVQHKSDEHRGVKGSYIDEWIKGKVSKCSLWV